MLHFFPIDISAMPQTDNPGGGYTFISELLTSMGIAILPKEKAPRSFIKSLGSGSKI
jgi:hypothetical protein